MSLDSFFKLSTRKVKIVSSSLGQMSAGGIISLQVLLVRYLGSSQAVKLHAEVHFPNLTFSSTLLDFGYVLNNSESQRQILMSNCSPLPVAYSWTFLKEPHTIR